jgi:hypothetical protein
MTSLISFSSSGNMPFWAILAVFLLVIPASLIGIATMWQFLQQKISDNISARVTKITNDLSAHDTKSFNAELYEINNKLTAEIRKLIHVMQAIPQRRRKSYRWLITDLIQSKKPAVMTLAGFRLKCTLLMLLSKHSRMK